jgi:hypothetical protein
MSIAPLTIEAADASGTQYDVNIQPQDADSATLSVTEWNAGEDPENDDPSAHNEYDLTGIKVAGDLITCSTASFFGTPQITITLGDASVTIAVSHIMFAPGPTTLPLDVKIAAQARAWLAAAKFPQGGAS